MTATIHPLPIPPTFRVTVGHHGERGDVLVIAPHGELDVAAESALREALDELTARAWTEVRVDLSGVTFMDSTGCNFLLRARRLVADDVPVVLCDPSPAVLTTLTVTHLHEIFPIRHH